MEITNEIIQNYLELLSQSSKEYHQEHFKNILPETFEVSKGRKYYKVIKFFTNKDGSKGEGNAFCFLDKQGNIFKAASWKSPAKGVRGSLFGDYKPTSLRELYY